MEQGCKSIKIIENSDETVIQFLGNFDNREDFLDVVIDYLISRFHAKYYFSNIFIRLIHEITKNIYDHALGKGRVTLKENARFVKFLVEDENTDKVYIKIIQKHGYSTGKPENNNKGIGIMMIKDLAIQRHNIFDFKRDTSKGGITYSGKFKKSVKPKAS